MGSVPTESLPMVRERGVCCELPAVDSAWASDRARLLRALADPTRLAMMASLWRAEGPVCICDFTATFNLSQPTISHHMGRLRDAGLVASEKRGIWVYYRVNDRAPDSTRALLGQLLG